LHWCLETYNYDGKAALLLEIVMRKIEALLALGLTLVLTSPVLAADGDSAAKADAPAKTDAAADATASDSKDGATTAGPAKKKHEHGQGHGHPHVAHASHHGVPGKRQVMGLADLTDKQKSDIGAIYDGKKGQFADLRKQMQALEADEWQQIKGILTPAQVAALGAKTPLTSVHAVEHAAPAPAKDAAPAQ
jgi:hypothetical protein